MVSSLRKPLVQAGYVGPAALAVRALRHRVAVETGAGQRVAQLVEVVDPAVAPQEELVEHEGLAVGQARFEPGRGHPQAVLSEHPAGTPVALHIPAQVGVVTRNSPPGASIRRTSVGGRSTPG